MAVYRHFQSVRTALYALFAGLALLGGLPHGAYAADDLFTVENVEVDVTADNAVEARNKALDEAQVKAYRMLAEKFYTPEQMATFADPDPLLVSAMVQDFEVTNEQLSKVRYKGVFTVRFRPNAVRQHLPVNEYGVVQAIENVPPTLVLPYYQVEKRTVLWDSSNVWLKAWAARPAQDDDSLIVPIGDLLDVSQMPDDKALTYDPQMLDQIMRRYSADQAAILIAVSKDAPAGLEISLYDARRTGPSYVRTLRVDAQPGEDAASLYARAVTQAAAMMKGNWKDQVMAQQQETAEQAAADPSLPQAIAPVHPAGPAYPYNGRVMFSSVQEWVRMKSALEQTPGVRSVVVKGLKPREAQIQISYAGDAVQLATSLQRAGVTMRSVTGQQAGYFPGANGAPVYEFTTVAAPRY